MSTIINLYQKFTATCKVIPNIDLFGNYEHSITKKVFQYIGEVKNVEQYFNRFVDFFFNLFL